MPSIEFHTRAAIADIPHPYPASLHVPDWLKSMAADFDHGGTLKRCPPFLAAMTAGYIIPAPADATLIMSADGVFSATGKAQYLSAHFAAQYAGAPFASSRVVKFENPWIIVTPSEYVCLITAPINRFEIPFLPLSGIVETGAYYQEVHLPMACAMQPGQTHRLLRGQPMIQVIPLRRENWESGTAAADLQRWNEQQQTFQANRSFYKEQVWQKARFD